MPTYVDLQTIHNPAPLTTPPATYGDQIRENEQYLYERGPFICTSATRPGSPFEGQTIYETDTDETLIYYGANWRRPWRMPWGRVDSVAAGGSDQTGIGASPTDVTGLTVTITAVANRRYKATILLPLTQVSSTGNQVVTVVADGGSSNVLFRTAIPAGNGETMGGFIEITGLAAGSRIIKVQAATTAGTITVPKASLANARLMVEDIGPNGAPT